MINEWRTKLSKQIFFWRMKISVKKGTKNKDIELSKKLIPRQLMVIVLNF